MPSRSTQTVIGIFLGLAVGLFFGEDVAYFGLFASGFIGLLQMAAMPFVVCSIIFSFGSLSARDLARLFRISAPILALMWGVGLLAVGVFSAALPSLSFGSFFSASLVQSPPPFDWVRLFIPSNVFDALAENLVPAVVVFSILFGVALSNVENNASILDLFRGARDALIRVNSLVARIVPLGTFFVVGYAAGTVPFENLARLQAYVVYNAIGAVVLSFVVLPALVSVLTPHSYRTVLSVSREALLTVFVVGSTFVVIPMISEAIRKLDKDLGERNHRSGAEPDFLVSLAYPLPDVGKIFAMFFVPFAAWYYGVSPSGSEWTAFYTAIVPVAFAKTTAAVPVLLDVMRIPADAFQLFLSVGVVAGRFGDMVQTMHLIVFSAIANCALRGRLELHRRNLILGGVGVAALLCLVLPALSVYTGRLAAAAPTQAPLIMGKGLSTEPVPFRVLSEVPEALSRSANADAGTLARIRAAGVVRVGYDPDELPFTFFNSSGELVGFDIEMAHQLAADLDVGIEFVPFTHASLEGQIRDRQIDIAMAGLEGTIQRAETNQLADSYLDVTMAFVVPDHRRKEFASEARIADIPALRLAVVESGFFEEVAETLFPNATIVPLASERNFFFAGDGPADALLTSAEIGSAWTLVRPTFAVAVPFKDQVGVPLYYLAGRDIEFEEFLEVWIELQAKNGTIAGLYDYWILGADPNRRRWSAKEDLLGWR